jgi:hypothetical protein
MGLFDSARKSRTPGAIGQAAVQAFMKLEIMQAIGPFEERIHSGRKFFQFCSFTWRCQLRKQPRGLRFQRFSDHKVSLYIFTTRDANARTRPRTTFKKPFQFQS